ncbi:MAG TPA: bacteriohemerythrin [bacterium]|nr:bacteriohemerythrin [bacterium]
MEKIKVATGIYWIEIPEVDMRILCGCPADSVKHMMKRGLISSREKNGVWYETGPNAILLSDVSAQNGSFANLAEFPVLQMFYRQGMLLPNHPNNTGRKPMLIGIADQARAQSEYIFRGNYGLVSAEEIMAAGVSESEAVDMMRLKNWFAFDDIRLTEDLVDTRIVDKEDVTLRDGVIVHRAGFNNYEFIYNGESERVDLNLAPGERYEAPYMMGLHSINREYFSVIHSGDGDGWDINRPCMSSVITFQGRVYLIDAGPNVLDSLTCLGIGVSEIEGIFHTHAHDDHFAGLTSLVRSDHRIKYYATPLVRASVVKKLSALMSIEEKSFDRYFDVRDLEFDKWNNVNGLEVMPLFSPHPVETSVMVFRALWRDGYRTYAHWADTVAFDVLGRMVTDDPNKSGVSKEFQDKVKELYLMKTNLKKIDIGGGLIHGRAEDFIDDESDKIILSHTALELTDAQKEIGANAVFGMTDVLIPGRQNYCAQCALDFLGDYFPESPRHDIEMLLNCPIENINAGSILVKKGEIADRIYLILSGVAEMLDSENGTRNQVSAGAMVGELSCVMKEPSNATYRTVSYVKALIMPSDFYMEFAKRNGYIDEIRRLHYNRQFLKNTWLFGEMVSYPTHNRIARGMETVICAKGEELPIKNWPGLYILTSGEVYLYSGRRIIERLRPGGFVGAEFALFGEQSVFKARAATDASMIKIDVSLVENIPIVYWKLQETYERRVKTFSARFDLEWRKEYKVNVSELDEQHRVMFAKANELLAAADEKNASFLPLLDSFIELVRSHFEREEALMSQYEYPDYDKQKGEHDRLLAELLEFKKRLSSGDWSEAAEFMDFIKNWFVSHTLLEDRKYGPFFEAAGLR